MSSQWVDLTLAHAKMAGAISYAKVKTDKADAMTLAELLRTYLIPEALPSLNMIGGSYMN